MKNCHTDALAGDLRSALDQAEDALLAFGLTTWRVTIVVRHPTHADEFIITGNDDNAEVAKLLEKNP